MAYSIYTVPKLPVHGWEYLWERERGPGLFLVPNIFNVDAFFPT